MAQLREMEEANQELFEKVMEKDAPSLERYGLNIKLLSTDKQPTIVKVVKGNNLIQYLANEEQEIICVILYEEAFEKLSQEYKEMIISHAISSIEYDTEKDKVTIKNGGSGINEGVYLKYGEKSVLAVFNGEHAIKQIEEEIAEAKRIKKENKKQKNKSIEIDVE